jgi:hypothetical protein
MFFLIINEFLYFFNAYLFQQLGGYLFEKKYAFLFIKYN